MKKIDFSSKYKFSFFFRYKKKPINDLYYIFTINRFLCYHAECKSYNLYI